MRLAREVEEERCSVLESDGKLYEQVERKGEKDSAGDILMTLTRTHMRSRWGRQVDGGNCPEEGECRVLVWKLVPRIHNR